jgi:hypothetical protein
MTSPAQSLPVLNRQSLKKKPGRNRTDRDKKGQIVNWDIDYFPNGEENELNPKEGSPQDGIYRFMLIVAVFILWIGGISVRLVHFADQRAQLASRTSSQSAGRT